MAHPDPGTHSTVEPDVTVVIPAFNAEKWVEEAIDSILYQTLGTDRVELILVNDGSTDRTAAIIDAYAKDNPGVIRAVHQENLGVSGAMNTGIDYATGKYIGFLGADDYLSSDALELVVNFFEDHHEEIDLAAIPITMFGTKSGLHPGNGNRFDSTGIIDARRDWKKVHIAGGGAFIKRSALDSYGIRFDPALFIGEDLAFNTRIIMRRLKYGVVADATYFNRRHPTGISLVTSASMTPGFYDTIVEHIHFALVEDALSLYGEVPRYVQSAICYDLRGRVKDSRAALQPAEDMTAYRARIAELLEHISDEVLLSMPLWREEKLFLLSLKYGDQMPSFTRRGTTFLWKKRPFYSFKTNPGKLNKPAECRMIFIDTNDSQLTIEGHVSCLPFPGARVAFLANGSLVETQPGSLPVRQTSSMGMLVPAPGISFRLQLPLNQPVDLTPVIVLAADDHSPEKICPLVWLPGPFTWFCGGSGVKFFRHDTDFTFFATSKTSLRIQPTRFLASLKHEAAFFVRSKQRGIGWDALRLRAYGLAQKSLRKHMRVRPSWLIQDRKLEAGDNGEALFRFANQKRKDGPIVKLVLSKDAAAYRTLRKIGPIVEPDSRAFGRAYVTASWMASSAGDALVVNPIPRALRTINDVRVRHFAFLQHGVTLHDISGWLNRADKGFQLFVTSAEAERKSITSGAYGYTPDQVPLTGMPRFDRLDSAPEGVVVIAPTWRKWLASPIDTNTLRRAPFPNFRRSDYFRFWDTLIHHARVTKALKESGMRIVFALHPCHEAEAPLFKETETVSVSPYPHDYRELFRTGNVLVTDYSSVAFDFAYLRKPVLYAQPDADVYLGGSHTGMSGYFSYDEDGFGPVARSLNDSVSHLVRLIKAGGAVPSEYQSRADEFFAYRDRNSSARVYDAMLERHSG